RAVPAEDHFGSGGGELPALLRVTRLDDHRMPLRAAGQGEPAADREMRAAVLDRADGARPDERARLLVGDDRVRPPGVPQLTRQADELGRPPVPVGVVEVAAPAEVLAGEGVVGGHHVPRGPALAEVIQRGQPPGQLIRFVEGGVDGGGQADPLGHRGQGAEHGERLGPADHVEVVDAALVLAQPQALGEEEEVERAAFGRPGQMDERGEVDLAAGAGIGPDRGVVHPGEVGGQMDPLAYHRSPPRWVSRAARKRPKRPRWYSSGWLGLCTSASVTSPTTSTWSPTSAVW